MGPEPTPAADFDTFGMEQQAAIAQDAYLASQGFTPAFAIQPAPTIKDYRAVLKKTGVMY